jgi:hypothetical protein
LFPFLFSTNIIILEQLKQAKRLVSQQNIYIAKWIKVLNVVQNTKRSRDDVLEPMTIRDDSETTSESVDEMEEHVGKKIRRGDE